MTEFGRCFTTFLQLSMGSSVQENQGFPGRITRESRGTKKHPGAKNMFGSNTLDTSRWLKYNRFENENKLKGIFYNENKNKN
jgi:hypothetical protein